LYFVYTFCTVRALLIAGFNWDNGNKEKCLKHGVSSVEVEALFLSAPLYVAPDLKHSVSEQRFIAAGSVEGRPLFVAFTLRSAPEGLTIRPISARPMHAKEASRYEQENTPTAY
jgi:uncharacterized protein